MHQDHQLQAVKNTDNCFVPSTVVITAGGTVTWENTDTAAHTASSGTAAGGPDGVFDSQLDYGWWKLFCYT